MRLGVKTSIMGVLIALVILLAGVSGNLVITKVKVYTDKKVYYVGEEVRIILENKSRRTIYLPNPAPWTILDERGKPIYSPVAAQVITPIKPGEKKEWVWNQTTFNRTTAPPGRYQVALRTVSEVYYAYFRIVERLPEERRVEFWGVKLLSLKVWWRDWGLWFDGKICCYGRVEGVNITYTGPFILKLEKRVDINGFRWWSFLAWVEGT
ncbi:MAG: hypothetical protein DRJ41_00365, partial [Thermoprotei archaeon]